MQISHFVCLLLLALAFTLPLLGLRAENWQTLELRIDAGRAAHSFSLQSYTNENGEQWTSLSTLGLVEDSGGPSSYVSLSGYVDLDATLSLRDDTASHVVGLVQSSGGWLVQSGSWSAADEYAQTRQFLLVGSARREHAFLMAQQSGSSWPWFTLGTRGALLDLDGSGSDPNALRREGLRSLHLRLQLLAGGPRHQ